MGHNRKPLRYKKERVVLSDILPYEVPVTFSNTHFYDFLVSNKITIDDYTLRWESNDNTLREIIKLLFDVEPNQAVVGCRIDLDRKSGLKAIPFSFKISHKENDFRELTIIHPKNQLALIDFYEKHKHTILYYCSTSPFSIRRPDRIAKFIFHRDVLHVEKLSKTQEYERVEEDEKEYENLKSFFVYKNYSNIHKFYESYQYHQCEKKYNTLFKFDISKCFDSIYSHSISWALLNKEIVKGNLKSSDDTFGGKFDTLMQDLNYGETNGIVIGPEFSRIFAELILQRIDRDVERILKDKDELVHKVHYEIFRYVDDYFVFYNDESAKDKILEAFRLQLKQFKLYISDTKTFHYQKPIITEITIAKQRITDLLTKHLVYRIDEQGVFQPSEEDRNSTADATEKSGSIYVSSNKLITKFKTIVKETSVDYKDIMNYSLSVFERKLSKILKDYGSLKKKKNSEKEFTRAILEILEFVFFLYSVSPRVNSTIRLCRILKRLTEVLGDEKSVNSDFKHLAFKKIYDNTYLVLQKNRSLEHTQVETLYLLIALAELGREYWLSTDALRQYARIEKNQAGEMYVNGSMNYFTITVLLFYMKNKKRYDSIRTFVKNHIRERFNSVSSKQIGKTSELVLLFFDILTCPYLETEFKMEILAMRGITNPALQEKIINYRKHWFTKWYKFDLGEELDRKQGFEVY